MLWLDGRAVEGSVAPFDLSDRGLLLGDGAFDTSLAINGTVVLGDHHVTRLAKTCAALGIPMPEELIAKLLERAAAEICAGTLRLTVTRGTGPRGLKPPSDPHPRTILSAQPGPPGAMWRPVSVGTTSIRRNETSPTSRHKCLGYLDSVLALSAAAETGAEEVVFLNSAGRVACAASGNIFILTGLELKTPPLEDGVLDGVVRAALLTLAPKAGLTPIETHLAPEELVNADAVFMTNSLRLVSPIIALDGAPTLTVGLAAISRLANALLAHIRYHHGTCPWIEKGLSAWPIFA